VDDTNTQVSGKSGIFLHVESDTGDVMPSLSVVESVRCLDCGAVYVKPSAGGTVRENPGCPECGYVGWVAAESRESFSERRSRIHFAVDPLQHRHG
jgi:hypothetical protein